MTELKPKLIYIIGPNFCVKSLAYESLKILSKKFSVICISEGPKIIDLNFEHIPLTFKREPSLINDLLSLSELTKILWKNRDAKKIITSTPKISLLTCLACIINRKDYVYLHRGAVYQNYIGIKFLIYKFIDRLIIRSSIKTIFISESLFSWVKSCLHLKNLTYERNYNSSKGVNLKKFFVKRPNYEYKKIRIGFCGRVAKDKGFEEIKNLILKYKNTNDVDVHIKGKIELNSPEKELFQKLINDKSIYFEEWDENVVAFYQNIDILFFPSKREGFGNVLIEAAACGVPSVAFDIPGVRDAVQHDKSGILTKLDNDICDITDQLIRNKNKLKDLSKNSRKFAEENFDQIKVLEDLHRSMDI